MDGLTILVLAVATHAATHAHAPASAPSPAAGVQQEQPPGDTVVAPVFAMPVVPDEVARSLPRATRHASDHFLVVSDASPSAVAAMLNSLERTRSSLLADLRARGYRIHEPPTRHLAILFADQPAFTEFAKEDGHVIKGARGYYKPTARRLQLFDPESTESVKEADATLAKNEEAIRVQQEATNRARANRVTRAQASTMQRQVDQARAQLAQQRAQRDAVVDQGLKVVAIHELVHQLLFECGVQSATGLNPLWLSEGLAVAFETSDPRVPGHPESMRDERFAQARQGLLAGRFLPLRVLVEATTIPSQSRPGDEDELDFYAQSCMLVRWCMTQRPAEFLSFLSACRSATTAEPLARFEASFGPIDAVERAYVRWLVETQVPELARVQQFKAVLAWTAPGH